MYIVNIVDFNILWLILLGLIVLLIGKIDIMLVILNFLIKMLFKVLLYCKYNFGKILLVVRIFDIDEKYLLSIFVLLILENVVLILFLLFVYCKGGILLVVFVWKMFLRSF